MRTSEKAVIGILGVFIIVVVLFIPIVPINYKELEPYQVTEQEPYQATETKTEQLTSINDYTIQAGHYVYQSAYVLSGKDVEYSVGAAIQ